jgi:hypothetical protein
MKKEGGREGEDSKEKEWRDGDSLYQESISDLLLAIVRVLFV